MEEDNNHIKVVCRIRPANARELNGGLRQSVQAKESNIIANTKPESRSFTFDYSAGENVSQEDIFNEVGIPITKSCVEGYNGTILCYGQTGSGKTYTIFGPDTANGLNDEDEEAMKQRGLVPRVLDYIWDHLAQNEVTSDGIKSFSCRCSFYEIYQERVYDLLDSAGGTNERGLSVREDAKHGVYVEGCIEEKVSSPQDAKRVLALGYRNRHVGATSMNRESSRSHAVFQLVIDTTVEKEGVRTMKSARFSMIDLAGSERQKDTNASGERLKEASQINKSLSALGNVINALAAVSTSGGRKHIHYRDSKLTFLLRDSLGGNSKTTLVGTLSPADGSLAESLSTLKFCQRAKAIKNNAIINEETAGTMEALQNEILSLKSRLSQFSSGQEQENGNVNLTPSKIRAPARYVITSPSSKHLKQVSDFFTTETEKLLRSSLSRVQVADEMSTRNESVIRDLHKQLTQTENFSMSMKMKVKMRDSEILRLKNKEGAPPEPLFDVAVKVEVDAVKQELQAEVVKHKLISEELERRLSLYEPVVETGGAEKSKKEANATPFTLWSNTQEIAFQHELNTTLISLQKRNEEMQQHVDDMGKGIFLAHFGFTVEEAQSLKSLNAELTSKHAELSITSEATKMALSGALANASDLEMNLMRVKGEFDSKKCEYECEKLQMSATISCLKEDLVDKSNEISALKGDIKRTDDEIVKTQQDKERELRNQHNKLMKDNMILVQSTRELESAIQDKHALLQQKADMVVDLQDKVSYVCEQLEVAGNKHKEAVGVLKAKLFDSEQLIISQKSALDQSDIRLFELEEANKAWSEEAQELKRKLEETSTDLLNSKVELQSSNDTVDNLNSQTETLIVNLEQEKFRHASSQDKIQQMQEEIDHSEIKSRLICSDLETEIAWRMQLENDLVVAVEERTTSQRTSANMQARLLETNALLAQKIVDIDQLQGILSGVKLTVCDLENQVSSQLDDIVSKQKEIDENNLSIEQLNSELSEFRDLLHDKEAAIEQLETLSAELNGKLVDQTSELEQAHDTVAQKTAEVADLRLNVAEHVTSIASLKQSLQEKTTAVDKLVNELDESRVAFSEKVADNEVLKSSCAELQDEVAVLSAASEQARETNALTSIELADLRMNAAENVLSIASMKESNAVKDDLIATLRDEISTLTGTVGQLQAEINSLQDTIADNVESITELTESVSEKENAMATLESLNASVSSERNDAIESLQRHIQELKTKSDLLNAMEESLAEATRCLECTAVNTKILESEISNATAMVTTRDSEIAQLQKDFHGVVEKKEHLQKLSTQQTAQLKVAQSSMSSLEAEKIKLDAKLEDMSSELSVMSEDKSDLLRQLLCANSANISHEEKIIKLSDEMSQLVSDNNILRGQVTIEKEAVEMRSQLLADATDQIDSLEKQISALVENVQQLESSLSKESQIVAKSCKEVEKAHLQMQEKTAAMFDLTNQLSEATTEISSMSEKLTRLQSKFCVSDAERNKALQSCTMFSEALSTVDGMLSAEPTGHISAEMLQKFQSVAVSGGTPVLGNLLIKLSSMSSANNTSRQSQIDSLEQEVAETKTIVDTMKKSMESVTAINVKLEGELESHKEREGEEKSAKLRERFARLETISKLEAMQAQLDSIKVKHAESMRVVKERDEELRGYRSTIKEHSETISALRIDLAEVTKEKDKLCGHTNNKQKIQLHMSLKKNIEEQTTQLKIMQEQLSRVTQERDSAIDECRRAQHHTSTTQQPSVAKKMLSDGTSAVPQMIRRSQVKRAPLADATSSSDNVTVTKNEVSHDTLNL